MTNPRRRARAVGSGRTRLCTPSPGRPRRERGARQGAWGQAGSAAGSPGLVQKERAAAAPAAVASLPHDPQKPLERARRDCVTGEAGGPYGGRGTRASRGRGLVAATQSTSGFRCGAAFPQVGKLRSDAAGSVTEAESDFRLTLY